MAIVDIHAHVYPQKISEKAVQATGDFYNVEMTGNGAPEYLAEVNRVTPITHTVICSVATTPKQVASINSFIAQSCADNPTLIGMMAMQQDCEDPEAAIDQGIALGLRGIKIHPDIQRVNLDDEHLMRVYEIAEKKGLPIIIHTGDYRYDYSHPRRMKRVLHEFPKLVVDAAHFGGWSVYDLATEFLEDERCFVDTSSAMMYLGKRRSRELIELYGADRVMFGSDFPMWSPQKEFAFLESLELPAADFEKVTWRNAERFLNMSIGS